MIRTVLVYGLLGGLLIAVLRLAEYRLLVVERSLEIYGGLVALIFSCVGIWLGLRLNRARTVVREVRIPVLIDAPATPPGPFAVDEQRQRDRGITRRELEILGLIAEGLTTKEIADQLFVSENTVKTHSGRLFGKLGAKRRTQAAQLGKRAGLIP